jgi:transposase
MPRSSPPRSQSQDTKVYGHRYSPVQRAQCLTLLVEGFSHREIEKKTGIKQSTQINIKRKAFARGFAPEQDSRIFECYVEDSARSGRLKEISPATEQRLLNAVKINRADREKSSEVLIYDC